MVSSRNIMVVRALLSWIFVFAIIQSVQGGIGEWKSYTDMKNVRSIASDGTTIWAGTSGGIFRFNPSDSSYQKFTNSEGLTTNDITAIFIDSFGDVWIGQQNGSIDIYSPRSNSWRYISNIADDKAKTNRAINRFFQSGDKMYIATSFGLSIFSVSKFEFGDTYVGFASLQQPIVTAAAVFQNRIFAATSGGIVASKVGATNLTDPQQWEISSTVANANSLAQFNGNLFAGIANGLIQFQNGIWINVAGTGGTAKIITQTDTALIFTESQQIKSLSINGINTLTNSFSSNALDGIVTIDSKLIVGFSDVGIGRYEVTSGQWKYYYPNGPNASSFVSMEVDNNGVLWCASGRIFGKGFYSFNGSAWINYTPQTHATLKFNDSYKISLGVNNSIWVSQTGGLTLLDGEGHIKKIFTGANPGFGNFVDYIDTLVYGGAVDSKNQIWFSNLKTSNALVLWKFSQDSVWTSYTHPTGYNSLMNIAIDNEGTKWFTNADPQFIPNPPNKKLIYFNETKNIGNAINGWGQISTEDGLPSNIVKSVFVDRGGDIWVGTTDGIVLITNALRITRVFNNSVRDQSINCIAIDPLNNKWIGTSTGIYVLSPDGTLLLDQYSVENTNGKLVDNNILSIAFDKKRGIAYFGTEKGLSSLEIAAVAAKTSLSTIDLSPNPVYLSDHNTVEIRGLIEESTIKVLSIYGKVLKQFPAQGGGRAFWDCTDGDGNSVATGIYIIIAHDRTGSQVASAKVAVIRK